GVEVNQQEMRMLLQQAAQQYRPEDRQRFVDYVSQDPMAQAQLRAPLYEDKVVDFLFDKAEVTEREVSREDLEAAIEAEEGEVAAPAKKAAKKASAKKADAAEGEEKPKKAPAKKAAKKADDADAAEGEAKPAKKAPAKKAAKKDA